MVKGILICILAACVCMACSSPTDNHDAGKLAPAPVVTGFFITNANGTILGTWGTPSDQPKGITGSTDVVFKGVAPNPFMSEFSLYYDLLQSGPVEIWMVQGRTTNTSDMISLGGAAVPVPYLTPSYMLLQSVQVAGGHMIDVDGTRFPAGLYRIYIRTATSLVWRDVLLAHSKDDIPPSLRERFN